MAKSTLDKIIERKEYQLEKLKLEIKSAKQLKQALTKEKKTNET